MTHAPVNWHWRWLRMKILLIMMTELVDFCFNIDLGII
jgi:hypothetical protein